MNSRRIPISSSLKPVVYVILVFFVILTPFAMLIPKFYSATQTLNSAVHTSSAPPCNVPDYRRRLIANLEPLVPDEPLEVWEGLGKEQNKIKYLPSMIDLDNNDRFIYIDLGARDYDSSIGNWFQKHYPKQNKTFHIYAVEADKTFHNQYTSRAGVTLLPYAAWVKNETVVFGSKPIVVKNQVWRKRPFGRIEGQSAAEDGMSAVTRVVAFDFIEWLQKTVRPEDFVVVKMDVEGTEIKLVQELVDRGAMCLIDELFMECHFDRFVKCCHGDRINRFGYSYAQCYHLFSKLRDQGCVVHQWW